MPFFKLCGICLLLSAGVLCGYFALLFERKRVAQAEGFLALARRLHCQIDTLKKPLPAILAEADGETLALCGWQAKERPVDLTALLDGCALCLSPAVCALLYDFANGLGAGYLAEQLKACDYLAATLTPYCDALRKELPRRERVALFLPVAGALALILLLL